VDPIPRMWIIPISHTSQTECQTLAPADGAKRVIYYRLRAVERCLAIEANNA